MELVSLTEPPSQAPSQNLESTDGVKTPPKNQASSSAVSSTTSNIPVVALDVDVLTDSIAARLATSLLGHVLFLKNQIPLPIVQLARMPIKDNNKATKLKIELLSAFDTLTSHLVTTFSALSTALAKSTSNGTDTDTPHRVYLAILVGSSLGTAKSKVFYGVDKFETRVWGDIEGSEFEEETGGVNSGSEELPEDSEEDDDTEEDTASEIESEGSGLSNGGNGNHKGDEEDEIGAEGDDDSGHEDSPQQENTVPDLPPPVPSSYQSRADEQRFLQGADRLLARTLASADANGHGISNEMSPSQTHILIRAPRRFVHPAWVPKQNLVKQMENALSDFLKETWPPASGSNSSSKNKKNQVEGVWVTGKAGLGNANFPPSDSSAHEDDELIWWSWDGKLVGFSDW